MKGIIMKHAVRLSILAAAFAAAATPHAAPIQGVGQIEKDWEMQCDNTGTCRIAGYSESGSDKPASVLFTRAAGENTPVEGEVYLMSEKELPNAELLIDGKAHGQVVLDKNSGYGKLSGSQTQALLTAVKRGQSVTFRHQNETWMLSNEGANVTLLHADTFQQREGTPGAFIHIGNEQKTVLAAQPKPVITVPSVLPAKPRATPPRPKSYKAIATAVRMTKKKTWRCIRLIKTTRCYPFSADAARIKAWMTISLPTAKAKR